ncbi:hypothetical protein VN12_23155 [Pirellula sp. SH-Sr6A]|uniref:tetratricopeptide repeat protein n=1 Tax=Pirellula sp. SH-Sr6A TaxID=1632865 RepID=UPI00078E25D1|nr:tetratricopeptide repeat protein [Pirellula sp. SH-Sr6A]AMV35044.1 hypothetical protein VN12_23155 [Pirellula sp. SH-Sr6A]
MNRITFIALLGCLLSLGVGCKMSAPIYTWQAAMVPRPGPVKVAVGPVGIASRAQRTSDLLNADLQEAASKLQFALQSTEPDQAANLLAIHPPELERVSLIQLVSYDAQPNDSATIGAARTVGADFILQGNIVNAKLKQDEAPKRKTLKTMLFGEKKIPEYVVTHWTITDVASGQRVAEKTLHFDLPSAEKRYFDLGYHIPGNDGRVLMASSRAAWELVASTPVRTEAMLDLPWFWIGSSQVRKGNGFAKQGRWDLAEREWQEVADRHPTNKAAWTNLSIAAAAKEDFELARNRVRHSDTYWPGDSTFKTKLWIEKHQREYHQAFGIAPPPDGWEFPDATIATHDGLPDSKDIYR